MMFKSVKMIETRRDLSDYIQADRKAQGMQHPLLAKLTFGENALIRKYMTNLRMAEYWKSNSKKWYGKNYVCLLFVEAS